MIITIAFDVKNHVEVMEGWPIKIGDTTFFLEREGSVLKRVCLAFSKVGTEHAPSISQPTTVGDALHVNIRGGDYPSLAINRIMNWQTAVSGLQIVDMDYDNYEIRFNPERLEEESLIHINAFKSGSIEKLNRYCDFEQIGRAFCVEPIADDRVESTSHYREGRIAFESGRYVDAYNNMFLFIETRYCDGKTGNDKQTNILLSRADFCEALERVSKEMLGQGEARQRGAFDLFKPWDDARTKIHALVMLRGKLRHHSLKSPHRWDPNRQREYESAARFLGAVVGDIVLKESLADIYSSTALDRFRQISISTGYETKITLNTYRLDKKRTLALDMSYPTTVISSMLCLVTVRNGIEACEKEGQLSDTVKFEATQSDLELFSLEFDVWAYTQTRAIETEKPIGLVTCSFEHLSAGVIMKHDFSIPTQSRKLTISDVWRLLRFSFDHIEEKDPTTRIMSLKLFLGDSRKAIVSYRVGHVVKN